MKVTASPAPSWSGVTVRRLCLPAVDLGPTLKLCFCWLVWLNVCVVWTSGPRSLKKKKQTKQKKQSLLIASESKLSPDVNGARSLPFPLHRGSHLAHQWGQLAVSLPPFHKRAESAIEWSGHLRYRCALVIITNTMPEVIHSCGPWEQVILHQHQGVMLKYVTITNR